MEEEVEVRDLVKVMVEKDADVRKVVQLMDARYVEEVVEDAMISQVLQIVSVMAVT